MLFNSVEFAWFFALVFAAYWALPSVRGQNRLLLASSYFFYGWWDVRFLYLVVLSTGLDFCCGLMLGPGRISASNRRKVSALVIAAAALFVLPPWVRAVRVVEPYSGRATAGALPWLDGLAGGRVVIDLDRLATPEPAGWAVLLGAIAAVAAGNLAYYPLAALSESRRRRVGLVLTVGANLLLLGCFKYFNFFVGSAEAALRGLGIAAEGWHLHVLLPAGISFYTFQSMSYAIDVSRGKMRAVDRLEDYALFVMFFPVLVAGPIERAWHMLPKLTSPRRLTLDRSTRGLYLVLLGLFKKVAIADGLAPAVSSVFGSSGAATWADVAAATACFAIQIYGDFSGYTDIARGVAKLLGFDLLHNFDLPYFSRSPSEFWQRWHITLSTWLRDYLYIPLGGNRAGEARTYRNLMITMALGGLWHGAAWNFVLWGLYHGAILCAYRLIGDERPKGAPPPKSGRARWLAAWALFAALTLYGWMLFRATSLAQVIGFTRILATGAGGLELGMKTPTLAALAGVPLLIVLECLEYRAGSREFYRGWPAPLRGALYASLIFILFMGLSNEPAQFIYFQF